MKDVDREVQGAEVIIRTTDSIDELDKLEKRLQDALIANRAYRDSFADKVGETDLFGNPTLEAIQAQIAVKNASEEIERLKKRLEELRVQRGKLSIEAGDFIGPPTPDWILREQYEAEMEKITKIDIESQKMRVDLMEESTKKFMALMRIELQEFELVAKEKNYTEEQSARHRALIRQKYEKQALDFLNTEYEKYIANRARLANEEATLAETQATAAQATIERQWDNAIIPVEDYLEQRRAAVEDHFDRETELVEKQIQDAKDLGKLEDIPVLEIKLKVIQEQKESALEEFKFGTSPEVYEEQLEREKEYYRRSMEIRQGAIDEEDTQALFNLKIEEMDALNAYELTAMQLKHDQEYAIAEAAGENVLQLTVRRLNQVKALQDKDAEYQKKRSKAITDWEKQQSTQRLQTAQLVFGGMAQAMGDMYEASGRKAEGFFYAQKALAIAEATIAALLAYNKVMAAEAGMFANKQAAAAMALATGMANVALIAAQTIAGPGGFAKGGRVKDGGIPVRVSNEEYVFSSAAVRRLGLNFMEDLNKGRIAARTATNVVFSRSAGTDGTEPRGYVRGPSGIDKIHTVLNEMQYVIRPEAVRKYGVGMLNALETGALSANDLKYLIERSRRFQEGGSVGGFTGSSETIASPGSQEVLASNVVVNIHNEGSPLETERTEMSRREQDQIFDIWLRDASQDMKKKRQVQNLVKG
jgi:hypothetical protein